MKIKRLQVIVNPVSGEKRPVLRLLSEILNTSSFAWDISITKKSGDEIMLAKKALQDDVDAIAVYGGDGTLSKVASVLYKTDKSLTIIPGGSANVFAETVGMPLDVTEALQLLAKERLVKKRIDMAFVNNQPLLVSITTGLIAKSVLNTTSELKGSFGKLAYFMESAKLLRSIKPTKFVLEIDGKIHRVNAIALIVANTGKFFFAGIPILKELSLTDGMVDVLAVKKDNLFSMAKMAALYLLRGEIHPNIKLWKGKKIDINASKKEAILIDDTPEKKQKDFTISVDPLSVHFLLPRLSNI